MNRIRLLMFENTTFKVGPSSLAQNAHASGGPMWLRSGNWSLRFLESRTSHPARCYWSLLGLAGPSNDQYGKFWRKEMEWHFRKHISENATTFHKTQKHFTKHNISQNNIVQNITFHKTHFTNTTTFQKTHFRKHN